MSIELICVYNAFTLRAGFYRISPMLAAQTHPDGKHSHLSRLRIKLETAGH